MGGQTLFPYDHPFTKMLLTFVDPSLSSNKAWLCPIIYRLKFSFVWSRFYFSQTSLNRQKFSHLWIIWNKSWNDNFSHLPPLPSFCGHWCKWYGTQWPNLQINQMEPLLDYHDVLFCNRSWCQKCVETNFRWFNSYILHTKAFSQFGLSGLRAGKPFKIRLNQI